MPNKESRFPSDEDLRKKGTGKMTTREAGHLGGEKVRDLIEKGEELEARKGRKSA